MSRRWLIIFPIVSLIFLAFRSRTRKVEGSSVGPAKIPYECFSNKNGHLSEYILYRNILLAQAMHETGNFTSNIYKTHNNMFGMKTPSIRMFVGKPGTIREDSGSAPYAMYDSPCQSVEDMVWYLRHMKIFPQITPEDVTDFNKMSQHATVYLSELKRRGYWTGDETQYRQAVIANLKKLMA